MSRDSQARYSLNKLDQLTEGITKVEDSTPWGWHYEPAEDRSWLKLRSKLETRGEVDSEQAQEVMDFEIALSKFSKEHPLSAMLVYPIIHGHTVEEVREIFGSRLKTDVDRHLGKAVVWMVSYLNGEDVDTRAARFKRGRRDR